MECARRVFLRTGFKGARVKDIAAEAELNEAILYRHFDSKEELFVAAILDPLENHLATILAAAQEFSVDADRDADQSIRLHEMMFETFVDIGPMLGTLFGDPAIGRDFYRKRVSPLLDSLVTISEKSRPAWWDAQITPAFVFRAMFGAHLFLELDARMRGARLDAHELAIQMSALLDRAYFSIGRGQPEM